MKYILQLVCVLVSLELVAQSPEGYRAAIEKAIEEKNIPRTDSILQQQAQLFSKQPDSLNNLIVYVGRNALNKSGSDEAAATVENFVAKIKTLTTEPAILRRSYIELAEFYNSAGKNALGYASLKEAEKYTLQLQHAPKAFFGQLDVSMGAFSKRMGNLGQAQFHFRRALELYEAEPDYENLYHVYNGIGSILYYASKLDSAKYFFDKALKALEKVAHNPENQFYRPAIIQNNLSGIYSIEGKTTDAIQAMKDCISNLKKFIGSKEPDPKKFSAISFQFEATDNLAGIYKELGDYRQAQELLLYSYQQKQQHLGKDDPGIFISQIIIGQLYYAMKEFDRSVSFINRGIQGITKSDASYGFWHADACYTLAQVYQHKGNIAQSTYYWERADSLYEQSLQGNYDNIYLEFLSNAALFYAEDKQMKRALAKSIKGYNYVSKTKGIESLLGFNQLLSFSEIYFAGGDYASALTYANKGLVVINKLLSTSSNLLDSVKMELNKPKVILLKVKSKYELLQQENVTDLNALLNELNESLNILEKRKSIFHDPQDVSALMAEYGDLVEFAKQLTLDLFMLDGSATWGDKLISLHESGIYNRIRFRLEKSGTSRFAHVPEGAEETEKKLKRAISDALHKEVSHDERMDAYLKATADWDQFLVKLQKEYPQYYSMRYGSIFKSSSDIKSVIPQQMTVVRYLFTGKTLMVLVVNSNQFVWTRLETDSLEDLITAISNPATTEKRMADILFGLHGQLWAPISKQINTSNLVDIPDGILYNLNFELLTPEKINSYRDLATKSLLANYNISYNYSLFLLNPRSDKEKLNKSFVAFAPGFTDQMKSTYRQSSHDSTSLDNNYLSLLPQPFSISLANHMQSQLGGNTYTYDQSTLQAFRSHAGDHKIIHIGTHAESDNLHPEFSRIIFAKDSADQSNSLYLFDIYNCELTSYLTVLTACETGKPGYQDGEGMLSLAHAFNYAGSESIITGLWKIDEQASAIIMELFYNNLLKGMDKDEALRNAKLQYLSKAEGRTLAPHYWAGLVLMGDTAPIEIKQSNNKMWLMAGLIVLMLWGGYLFFRKAQAKQA